MLQIIGANKFSSKNELYLINNGNTFSEDGF